MTYILELKTGRVAKEIAERVNLLPSKCEEKILDPKHPLNSRPCVAFLKSHRISRKPG